MRGLQAEFGQYVFQGGVISGFFERGAGSFGVGCVLGGLQFCGDLRRNDIAHRADLDPQGNRRPMTADEAGTAAEWVFRLAEALTDVLG